MTDFLRGVLAPLGKIYRPVGGQVATRSIDLASPIQLVHGVERMAELAGGAGAYHGYSSISFTNVHATDTLHKNFDVYNGAAYTTLGVSQAEYWSWLMEASVRLEAALSGITAMLSIAQVAIAGAITTHQVLTHFWDTETGIQMQSAGETALLRTGSTPAQVQLPRLLTRGSILHFASNATGAGTLIGQATMYTCPIGTLPPGVS